MRERLRFPPKVFQIEDLLSQVPRLRALFSQEGVTGAWLLGSVLNGQAQPGSDLDIAIQGEEEYNWPELYGKVYHGLCEVLQADNIDLIILNEAPSSLQILASQGGFPLYAPRGDEALPPPPLPPAREPPPGEGAAALTPLGEALQGLKAGIEDDPRLLEPTLRKGIRAAFASSKWLTEGVNRGRYERLAIAEEALQDEVSPFHFSDWIAALLTLRKVMVHFLSKLEGEPTTVTDMPTFVGCLGQVYSYLEFAWG